MCDHGCDRFIVQLFLQSGICVCEENFIKFFIERFVKLNDKQKLRFPKNHCNRVFYDKTDVKICLKNRKRKTG